MQDGGKYLTLKYEYKYMYQVLHFCYMCISCGSWSAAASTATKIFSMATDWTNNYTFPEQKQPIKLMTPLVHVLQERQI